MVYLTSKLLSNNRFTACMSANSCMIVFIINLLFKNKSGFHFYVNPVFKVEVAPSSFAFYEIYVTVIGILTFMLLINIKFGTF